MLALKVESTQGIDDVLLLIGRHSRVNRQTQHRIGEFLRQGEVTPPVAKFSIGGL